MGGGYPPFSALKPSLSSVSKGTKMALWGVTKLPLMPIISFNSNRFSKPIRCTSLQLQATEADARIECEPCDGRGWLTCDFCKGQKTNVKSETNRIYRRCPSCRAAGYVLCSKCKVFKCVTFPDQSDGGF